MTSLFHARRSAEEFAAAVDGESRTRAAHSSEIATLAQLVTTLRAQEPVAPRDEFAADLRSRLMLEAETVLTPANAGLLLPARQRGTRERRMVAAASAFVLIGGTTTMAAAAQSALPGEALYPIKRGIEQAAVQLSMSDAGKGRDLLDQAADRLVEVEGLLASDNLQSGPRVPATLEAFAASASEGSSLLFDSYRENGDPDAIVSVRTFTTEGIVALEALADKVPSEAQGALAGAALLLRDIDAEASALCDTCAGDLDVVEVPGLFLARAEVDRALELASTRELDNNHPIVVPKDREVRTAPAAVPSAPPTKEATEQVESGGAPAPTPLPAPTWEPDSWPSLLPGLTEETSGGANTQEPATVEKVGENLGEGLSGAVETLLPDTDGSLLD